MRIAIGADPFGVPLKGKLLGYLIERGYHVDDLGGNEESPIPYYDAASKLASLVSKGEVDRGVLICGTGMGMSIIANKYRGVYAAVCDNPDTAQKARSINNANVVTLGAMLIGEHRAREIVDIFMNTEFKAGWDRQICSFLDQSMNDIRTIESDIFRSLKV